MLQLVRYLCDRHGTYPPPWQVISQPWHSNWGAVTASVLQEACALLAPGASRMLTQAMIAIDFSCGLLQHASPALQHCMPQLM